MYNNQFIIMLWGGGGGEDIVFGIEASPQHLPPPVDKTLLMCNVISMYNNSISCTYCILFELVAYKTESNYVKL